MTAVEFAALVDGRAAGRNRFQAHCPAHRDRSPSLSIREGTEGRVLLHCFAGCTADAILSALKLSRRDLFQGPPPSPARRAALEAERIATEQRKRTARAAENEAWRQVRLWEAVVNALGAKLAHTPDDAPNSDRLTRIFHKACERLGKAETAALAVSGIREAA
jgi:hypothetical protein